VKLKIELKRSVRKVWEDTKKEDIQFEVVFTPENVDDTLLLKELEDLRKDGQKDGYYNDKWEEKKFIILLS